MSRGRELSFAVEFGKRKTQPREGDREPLGAIPRISRLMALALRFQGLVKAGEVRDYAELARLGRVTRTRITQIMKLLDLAPGIQEQLLFSSTCGLTERKLRNVVRHLDWDKQREAFRNLAAPGEQDRADSGSCERTERMKRCGADRSGSVC
jgi:hypothetical protein